MQDYLNSKIKTTSTSNSSKSSSGAAEEESDSQCTSAPAKVEAKTKEFIEACMFENASKVEKLIEEDKSIVNKGNEEGWTGMMQAASDTSLSLLTKILATPEVDICMKDNYGRTALHAACFMNAAESIKLLLQHPQCTPEFVNWKDKKGTTAEMVAKEEEHTDCLELLQKFLKQE